MKSRLLLNTATAAFLINPSHAFVITLDYTYDTNNFFGSAGSAQRTSLEAARNFFQNTIDQDFEAITPGGSNTWTARFVHPGTGGIQEIVDMIVPENAITIFVGGQELGSTTLGFAGRGGSTAFGTQAFLDSVSRGDSSDKFGLWGGSASFDSVGTNWNFSLGPPTTTQSDFYSVALHEMGHVLGLSAQSSAWDDHWTPGTDSAADSSPGTPGQFTGANAVAAYNADNTLASGFVPTVPAMQDDPGTSPANEEDLTNRHFQDGTQSFVFGTTTLQELAMAPNLTQGTRKEFTNVDVRAFQDIGWTVIPEPSTALLLLAATGLLARRYR